MNRILITGATGFVGANLKDFLRREFEIESLKVRFNEVPEFNFSGCYALLHLAGKAHDLKNVSVQAEYYEGNYSLTTELYNAFLKSGAQKFIFMSSVKACADQVKNILKESDRPDPKTHYGKSKLMAEEYIQSQPLPQGKSYYILRPCMIHGPGNKGNLNLLYKLISKGIPYPLAAFENKRSFLSIENLCFVIRELLERNDIPSGVYNISDNEALSTNELINLIGQASHKKTLLWKISPGLIRSLAKLGDVLKLPLTTERLNKLTENYIVDNTKIRLALGKEFPVQARDGIMTTIKSFQGVDK